MDAIAWGILVAVSLLGVAGILVWLVLVEFRRNAVTGTLMMLVLGTLLAVLATCVVGGGASPL